MSVPRGGFNRRREEAREERRLMAPERAEAQQSCHRLERQRVEEA